MSELIYCLIGIVAGAIISIIIYLIGKKKRYKNNLYCLLAQEFRVLTTGVFSNKMDVRYNGVQLQKGMGMICFRRTFVNIEEDDISCKDSPIKLIIPGGKWIDVKLIGVSETIPVKDVSVEISKDNPSVLELSFNLLRANEGICIEGLAEDNSKNLGPFFDLRLEHRIRNMSNFQCVPDGIVDVIEELDINYIHKKIYITLAMMFLAASVFALGKCRPIAPPAENIFCISVFIGSILALISFCFNLKTAKCHEKVRAIHKKIKFLDD